MVDEGHCIIDDEHELTPDKTRCSLEPTEHSNHVHPNASPGWGITFDKDNYGKETTTSVTSGATYFPGTEKYLPIGEMRITFLGTAPFPPRLKQSGTSILVELGQGSYKDGADNEVYRRPKRYIFDAGPGSSRTATAVQIPWQEIDTFFLTHLHGDHIIDLGYYYCFGAWSGRWTPIRVIGPDGLDGVSSDVHQDSDNNNSYPVYHTNELDKIDDEDTAGYGEDGTVAMIKGMQQMYKWHTDAFKVFPAGDGFEFEVHQFDHRTGVEGDGEGVAWDEYFTTGEGDNACNQRVKVFHWPRIHAKSGASAYRLEWSWDLLDKDDLGTDGNTLKFVWTGDGRPDNLTMNYNGSDGDSGYDSTKRVDILVTEAQMDTAELTGAKYGIPPELYQYTIDTHHTLEYAVGHLMKNTNPRMGMVTHAEFDMDSLTEFIGGVRYHWKGMFALGIPDGIVVNVTPQDIWYREAAMPEYAGNAIPGVELIHDYDNYYKNVWHADEELRRPWQHETQPVPGTVYVPNTKNEIIDLVDKRILAQETEACEYFPPEVRRPLLTECEKNTTKDLPSPPDDQ